ncbi:MAG: septal ring lytic transglycosylase RlpA family protein [Tepidanaerobacteraceae bacterium]|nr:septal ring lytic transglycosylase RlpA family protein [Tepidanaerobacteraceae bacterium]
MGKRISGMVLIFLVLFCFCGPTKGGQSDEYVIPVYDSIKETEPYLPVKNHIQFTQSTGIMVGKASWYGPGFHGKTTANGETFNENALTAAHKELSFGTKVLITNLNNGKSTIVTINDRGPYIEGRDIDISRAAARQVGMIDAGVVDVKMEIIAHK